MAGQSGHRAWFLRPGTSHAFRRSGWRGRCRQRPRDTHFRIPLHEGRPPTPGKVRSPVHGTNTPARDSTHGVPRPPPPHHPAASRIRPAHRSALDRHCQTADALIGIPEDRGPIQGEPLDVHSCKIAGVKHPCVGRTPGQDLRRRKVRSVAVDCFSNRIVDLHVKVPLPGWCGRIRDRSPGRHPTLALGPRDGTEATKSLYGCASAEGTDCDQGHNDPIGLPDGAANVAWSTRRHAFRAGVRWATNSGGAASLRRHPAAFGASERRFPAGPCPLD